MKKIVTGILGTADIAARGIIEPSKKRDDITIWGVASRDLSRARQFAREHEIPNAFAGYDTLLEHEEIDLVYIPLITGLHAEWLVKAANAGKHVLVEKPVCMSSKDFEAIRAAVAANKVHVLEGLMAQHHPSQQKLKEIVDSAVYGRLKSIRTRACYRLEDEADFRFYPEKGGGVFFEEGNLWCQITQLCLGLEPKSLSGESAFNGPNGVDTTFYARMEYSGGVFSELFCSYEEPYEANHWFEFEKAALKIRNFWKPTFGLFKMHFDILHLDIKKEERITFAPCNYFESQLDYFIDVIKEKRDNISLDESFDRIAIMESIYTDAKGMSLDGVRSSSQKEMV